MWRIKAKAFNNNLQQILLAASMNALYASRIPGNPEMFYKQRDRFPYGWGYYENEI